MKRTLSMIALAVLTIGLLGSCSKINERLDNLDKRIDGLENEQIASINTQIANINSSIADLGQIRSDISSLKQSAETHGQEIFALQEADETLRNRILNLEDYIDGILPKYAEKEWVEATFSTQAQYEATCDTIAKIDARIGALDAKLSKDIKACADSLTKWVNKTFEGYYTAAQMDAKVAQMKSDIDSAKAANKITDIKADSISAELTKTKTEVDTAKAAIRAEYKAAVKAAIEESEGKLTKELTDAITEVNESITILFGKVAALETTVATLTGRVDKLEKMIQSVTIVPVYSDGSVEVKDGILYLDIVVEPSDAVVGLTKDSLKVLVNEVKAKTKAVKVDTVSVANIKVDAVKGIVTARADISSKLPKDSKKELTVAVNVKNGLSDHTTKFYPVALSSNVKVEDKEDTTKVTISADADFPGLVIGNIVVADGFKDSKPTTIDVQGIGNVIFDTEATAKIKANAQEAGATSVLFKVEDVTTTKPVPNADVVLEVTMKTVDENGTEVFNDKNAKGEVTIQIPMADDVAYVNSVTLVDDDGDPIEGGVVPGSEEIENGILTFKVNHFSKYAIDYVTSGQFVEVTGVSIEPVSVTLQVGDTLRLVANIAPEDATNKKVTWSSSDTTKVKVDDTGKITAVAFGKATITVTTKDGNKTADRTVKVSETKTMADILNTATGIPESQDLTPPANAWVKKTDKECKAFVGIDAEGDKLFVILKAGQELAPLGICMDDAFARIDDNTYQRIEPSVGTFTIKMAEGKFTSYEFAAVSGSAYEQFNGTYSAPVSKEYVEIAAKYDGSTVSTLRWYRQSLAITDSGKKAWKGGSGSAVKVPGTGEDVVVGDYFQWGTFTGFYGNGAGTDKGLLPYTSFTNTGCGDGSDAFTFKSGKQFNEEENAPYWSGSAYTKYNTTDGKTELDASDDVASIILGGTWRMPTTKEFQALKEVTYWAWDATDKGYYVYTPNPASDAGKVNDGTGTYNKADALLFFPAVGLGYGGTLYSDDNSIAYYWSRTLDSNPAHAYAMSIDKSEIHPDEEEITARGFGFAIRPVQDPAATYVAVTNVSLDVTAKEIEKGGNVQLKVTVAPATATQNGVYWTSSAPAVATVDATGKVTGVKAGPATITATTVDGTMTASCTVTVKTPVTTFKAVYNTNGDANTLTFYYDANDHSGEGITVYDNLPTAATKAADWGYNSNRGKIKSVVIDASVAGYKGLTSTAFMFQGMTTATNISGAEHLDVSNVTDMSFMFNNFGGGKSGSPTTLNVVPDVSKWNTGNVKNMTAMFESYGNFSSSLDKVPDVSGWNTGNVTNMFFMFQKYGHESQNFNAVPDVSKWNTGKVEDMHQMFFEYGHKSTALNTVPDVSGWNTGKVTNMSGMFNGYGYTSTNISCVLDLSGWDLSEITGTNGNNVFAFTPKTFDVTIPAKTGEKSNEGGKWYYGNGTNYIAPPTGKTFTPTLAGALPGVFSVSATKKVHFSKGNLQATYNSSASTYAWGFAANQYDYIGDAAGNTTIDSQTNGAVVDIFGWSTASTTYGISTSTSDKNYSGDFVDWGKAIDDKGTWSTLSKNEWAYLFNTRKVNGGTKEGKSYQIATINSDATSVYGMILYPDNYTSQTSATSYTSIEWTTMEENGCVFLPAAGSRKGSEVDGVGGGGFWSSTVSSDQEMAYLALFYGGRPPFVSDDYRKIGYSVRLITEVK